MVGPWEKYQNPDAPMAAGPWAKYRQPSDTGSNIFAGLPQETADQIRARFPEPAQPESAAPLGDFDRAFNMGIAGAPDKAQAARSQQERAANLERIRLENPALAEQIESMPELQKFIVGAGQAYDNVYHGAKRLVGAMDEGEIREQQAKNAATDQLGSTSPAVGMGEFSAMLPAYYAGGSATAAIKSTLPRIAAGAGIGAAEGGLPALGEGEDLVDVASKAAIGAGLNVAAGELFNLGKMSPAKQKIRDMIKSDPKSKEVVRYFIDGAGKVQKDKLAKEAIRQGFDDGVIAVTKGASKSDKAKMLRMINTVERGKKNALYAAQNRPADVVGDSLAKRVKYVQRVNKAAGQRLDKVAQGLKGKQVDYAPAVDQFVDDLQSLGVKFDPQTAKVNFQGSDLEGLTGAQGIIRRVLGRMYNTKAPDAYDIHRMKKFIDEQVSYGSKNAKGLAGKSESIVKSLRRNLDQTLDDAFPKYNDVNTRYADTREVLDGYQKAVGRSIDFNSQNADKALGTVSRRLLSNAQTRVQQMDMLSEVEAIARKYGAEFDDDIMTQVLFADELDRVFGPAARTSLQGDADKVAQRATRLATQSKLETAADVASGVTRKVRGVSEEKAMEAIRGVLRQ